MFRVIRCIKCGHVIAGEDSFIERLMERFNTNLKKINHAKGSYLNMLLMENSMLRAYLKQILHWQNQQIVHAELDSFKLQALIKFIKEKQLMTESEMGMILDRAEELQKQRLIHDGEKLKQLYGDFDSFLSNRSKSDPTANAAIGSVMKGGKYNG